jgi:nucleobase:cation symporter-1, NCS1 family
MADPRHGLTNLPETTILLSSMQTSSASLAAPRRAAETHGIDFVPLSERYGTPLRLFTIWFSSNLTILGVALGAIGVVAGLGLTWAILALALGNMIGTFIMAAHSAQGPQLGVPQMIQSRAQFGVVGAAVPLVAVAVMYLLYCAANGILILSAVRLLVPVGANTALVLFAIATGLVAYYGYELIHRIGKLLSVVSSAFFLLAACLLLYKHSAQTGALLHSAGHFSSAAFAITVTQAAAWSLTYGPYVADYSRYLPPEVSVAKTFWFTACGNFLGTAVVMSLGACLAAVDPLAADNSAAAVSGLFGVAKPAALLFLCVGVIQGNTLTLYSAYLSCVTIVSGKGGAQPVRKNAKLLLIGSLVTLAASISFFAQDNFNTYFADALNVMIYLLIPWSAINLTDYYFVRRGHYQVADFYRPDGRYGSFQWWTLAVFALGILVQIPFVSLSFFHGAVFRATGADFAWLPGLLVSAGAYLAVHRGPAHLS